MYSTILNASILGNHFSPLLAALSPLFLLWDDPRMLFLVQAVCLAATGCFLFKIVRDRHNALAPWFLAAFLLNPAVHEITLFEFRRVALAMPFIALALYALCAKKCWWMLAGLVLALLCKENVAFVVAMVGLYLLLVERDWKWGAPIPLARSSLKRMESICLPLEAPQTERTISVRIVDVNGAVVAQHDGLPAGGTKPTSWWEPGWEVRDIHYMAVPEDTAPGPVTLYLVVYDTYSQEVLPFGEGQAEIELLPITISS